MRGSWDGTTCMDFDCSNSSVSEGVLPRLFELKSDEWYDMFTSELCSFDTESSRIISIALYGKSMVSGISVSLSFS